MLYLEYELNFSLKQVLNFLRIFYFYNDFLFMYVVNYYKIILRGFS